MADDVLGAGFTARTIPLRPDAAGDARATLVRLPAEHNTRGAMLLLHGYADYFFQASVARHFAATGFDVYGLDLRGYGRSLLPHQVPNYVTDLTIYFEDVDRAVELIRQVDGHGRLVVLGHSTGGLIASLWAHERRTTGVPDALVLNSPWLDLAEPWLTRVIGTFAMRGLGRVRPTLVVRSGLGSVYGRTLHRDFHGEWDYDLRWKPLAGFPVRAGWLRSVRHGQRVVQRGLDIPAPVLVLHSARSLLRVTRWSDEAMGADTVLDVAQIARWAPKIGRRVTVVSVDGGVHDVFLSASDARERAFAQVGDWLAAHVPAP